MHLRSAARPGPDASRPGREDLGLGSGGTSIITLGMDTSTRPRAGAAASRLVLVFALLALTGLFALTTVDSSVPTAVGAVAAEHVSQHPSGEAAAVQVDGAQGSHDDTLTLLCLCALLIASVVIAARGAVLHRSTRPELGLVDLVGGVRAGRSPVVADPWAWGISRT